MAANVSEFGRAECLRRLRSASVGRVAVTHRALPVIVPVNYAVAGNAVIFRTETGGMLAHACDNTVIAFEVDDVADGRSGWSVLVVGVAELLAGSAAVRALETGLVSAMGDGRDQFVAVRIGEVSGREVAAEEEWIGAPA